MQRGRCIYFENPPYYMYHIGGKYSSLYRKAKELSVMSKYQSWILNKRELTPLSNIVTMDSEGNIRRHICNTYECPYCHKTVTCTMTNKINIRKCRYCNHSVSPYKGDVTDIIYLPEGVEDII